jgi:hypothetical protein
MFIVILIAAVIVLFGAAAAIQLFISPAELHEMGIWLDNPQF